MDVEEFKKRKAIEKLYFNEYRHFQRLPIPEQEKLLDIIFKYTEDFLEGAKNGTY